MQRALVVMTTALLAAAQTTPSICQSNSDCSSGLVCSNGACSAAGSATADPINCTITTLSQCGSDWSTRFKQPLVIGLIVGGGVLLLICLPTIICCIVKGTICFAFKTTKKVAVGSAKAVAGAAKHTAPDRHRPPTNSQIIANRARIYGGGEESNDQKSEYKTGYQEEDEYYRRNQAENQRGPVAPRRDYRGAQQFPLNDDRSPYDDNPYQQPPQNQNQYGAPQQSYTTPAQIYPPQPAAVAGYGYQAAAATQPMVAAYPPVVAPVNQAYQYNPYGAPVVAAAPVVAYNNQLYAPPAAVSAYGQPVVAPTTQYNPYTNQYVQQQQQPQQPQPQYYQQQQSQQQPQYQLPTDYTPSPPSTAHPTKLQEMLNNHNHNPTTTATNPLDDPTLSPLESFSDEPGSPRNHLTSTNSSSSFAKGGVFMPPPPPAHSPSPDPYARRTATEASNGVSVGAGGGGRARRPERGESAVASSARQQLAQQQQQQQQQQQDLEDEHQQQQHQQTQDVTTELNHQQRRPRNINTTDQHQQQHQLFNDRDSVASPTGSEDIVSTYMDGDSSSDDSELRGPESGIGFHGRDHTVARRIDPAKVALGAPVRRESGAGKRLSGGGRRSPEEQRREFEERELQARASGGGMRGSSEGADVRRSRERSGQGVEAFAESSRRPRTRTSAEATESGRPSRTEENSRPRSHERDDALPAGGRPRSNDRDLTQQQQQQLARPRSNERNLNQSRPRSNERDNENPFNQQKPLGYTPRARSGERAAEQPQQQLQTGYTPRARTASASVPEYQELSVSPTPHIISNNNNNSNAQILERLPTNESDKHSHPERPTHEPRKATNHANRLSKDYAIADAGAGYALRSTVAAKRASREIDVAVARERAAKRASGGFEAPVVGASHSNSSGSGSESSGNGRGGGVDQKRERERSRDRSSGGDTHNGASVRERSRERSVGRVEGVYDSPTANALAKEYATTQWDDLDRGRSAAVIKNVPPAEVDPLHAKAESVAAAAPPGMSARAYYLARYGGAKSSTAATGAASAGSETEAVVSAPPSSSSNETGDHDASNSSTSIAAGRAARSRSRARGDN